MGSNKQHRLAEPTILGLSISPIEPEDNRFCRTSREAAESSD
jgi:hypothetical protein